jgi:hypothetical protein
MRLRGYKMKFFLSALTLIFVLLLSVDRSFAHDDAVWTEIENRSDVEITEKNGKKTALFSSGVSISKDGRGVDNSGLGAVSCAWMVHSHTYQLLKACMPSRESYLKAYGEAVDRIEDFIVENSLTPVSKSELQKNAETMFDMSKQQMSMEQLCESDFLPNSDGDLSEEKSKTFRQSIDKILSVPRPPVMEPCI